VLPTIISQGERKLGAMIGAFTRHGLSHCGLCNDQIKAIANQMIPAFILHGPVEVRIFWLNESVIPCPGK